MSYGLSGQAQGLTFLQLLCYGSHSLSLVLATQPLWHPPGVEGHNFEVWNAEVVLVAGPLVFEVDGVDGQNMAAGNKEDSHEK